MILYTEAQLDKAYEIDRKERIRLGINTTTREQYRGIYEKIMETIYED